MREVNRALWICQSAFADLSFAVFVDQPIWPKLFSLGQIGWFTNTLCHNVNKIIKSEIQSKETCKNPWSTAFEESANSWKLCTESIIQTNFVAKFADLQTYSPPSSVLQASTRFWSQRQALNCKWMVIKNEKFDNIYPQNEKLLPRCN